MMLLVMPLGELLLLLGCIVFFLSMAEKAAALRNCTSVKGSAVLFVFNFSQIFG
jgi:hypothetical protein